MTFKVHRVIVDGKRRLIGPVRLSEVQKALSLDATLQLRRLVNHGYKGPNRNGG